MTDTKLTKHEEANIALSDEMKKMYQENADKGTQNLDGELPILKVHATGRSSNELSDGSEPKDGWFFYKPTQEQFETVTCHILSISAGYYAKPLEEGKKDVFTQIMSGITLEKDGEKPFHMYFTGGKLQHLWNFGKEIHKYTHAKPYPIPMFTLTVKLTTAKEETEKYGKVWRVRFEVVKDENGRPLTVTDPGRFIFLRDMVDGIEKNINKIIDNKGETEFDLSDDQMKEIETA